MNSSHARIRSNYFTLPVEEPAWCRRPSHECQHDMMPCDDVWLGKRLFNAAYTVENLHCLPKPSYIDTRESILILFGRNITQVHTGGNRETNACMKRMIMLANTVSSVTSLTVTGFCVYRPTGWANNCSAVAEMGDCLATIDMGRKLGDVIFYVMAVIFVESG